jgi:hypothetical protein
MKTVESGEESQHGIRANVLLRMPYNRKRRLACKLSASLHAL